MSRTINLLTADSGLYSSTSSSVSIPLGQSGTQWSSTNSTLSIITTEFVTTLRRVCRLAPSGTIDIELSLPTQHIPSGYSGSKISFNAKVKPPSEVTVMTLLSVDGEIMPTGNQQRQKH